MFSLTVSFDEPFSPEQPIMIKAENMLTGKNITYYEGEVQKTAFVADIDDDKNAKLIVIDIINPITRNANISNIASPPHS